MQWRFRSRWNSIILAKDPVRPFRKPLDFRPGLKNVVIQCHLSYVAAIDRPLKGMLDGHQWMRMRHYSANVIYGEPFTKALAIRIGVAVKIIERRGLNNLRLGWQSVPQRAGKAAISYAKVLSEVFGWEGEYELVCMSTIVCRKWHQKSIYATLKSTQGLCRQYDASVFNLLVSNVKMP